MRELADDAVARQIVGELSKIENKVLEAQGKGLGIIRVQHENLDRLWVYKPK